VAYIAPYLDSSGIHFPTYADILTDLEDGFKSLYGQDVYLGNDSIDHQFLAIIALRIYDTFQSVQLAYNNRGPLTAVGSGLDQIVKINGIARLVATYSTAVLTLTGTIGTVITDGVATPTTITASGSPETGSVDVTATCETIGAVTAQAGDIDAIATPTSGWTGVTNAAAATSGAPVETDAQLRARQVMSVTKPSMTLLSGTWAAIAALSTVTRVSVLENPTNVEDANGLPPHSVACIVEGGVNADIAEAIWLNKGIGPLTHPVQTYPDAATAVHVAVVDSYSGISSIINFSRPVYVPIFVEVVITPLAGYSAALATEIKTAIAAYLNSLAIGEDLAVSVLYGIAYAVSPTLTKPAFSISAVYASLSAIESPPSGTTDIVMAYNEVSQGDFDNVTVSDGL
jgi:uncharacterized phage protein gp47/JayE